MSFDEDLDISRPITISEYHLAVMVVVAALLNPRMSSHYSSTTYYDLW
jgi:hypothetical protein